MAQGYSRTERSCLNLNPKDCEVAADGEEENESPPSQWISST